MRAALLALAFLLAGLGQAASIAMPGSGRPLWLLQLVSLGVLAFGLRRLRDENAGWRRAGLHAWLFSTAWLSGTFWWLFISMHTYGGLAAPLAAIAVLALAAALGLYYALAGAWFVRRGPRGTVTGALVFAALWTLAELVRGSWFTYPPNAISVVDSQVLQIRAESMPPYRRRRSSRKRATVWLCTGSPCT